MDRLDELINGSETAKSALREREEGILVYGQQKKRKSTKKEKVNDKKQKKVDFKCVQKFKDAARPCPL